MSSVKYIKSAVFPKDFPRTALKEIAFAGRSNAGKSSLINSIVNSKIANISKTPGKTRLLSFFNYSDLYMLVDMPGYGYAARANEEISMWQDMIESYLETSEKLKGVVLVMDIRRDWQREEQQLKNFTEHYGIPLILALTKADKLSRSQQALRFKAVQDQSLVSSIFVCSSLKKTGIEELQKFLKKQVNIKSK